MTALSYYQWESVSLSGALGNDLASSYHFTYSHTVFESQTTHLVCSVPLHDLMTDHKDLTTDYILSSLSQLSI